MSNSKSNENRIIFEYIGHHPEYGKHKCVCHVCGTDWVSGKIKFDGNHNGVWSGEHFEFPICDICFYEALGTLMERMDTVMLQREIEREKMWEKEWLEYDPPC